MKALSKARNQNDKCQSFHLERHPERLSHQGIKKCPSVCLLVGERGRYDQQDKEIRDDTDTNNRKSPVPLDLSDRASLLSFEVWGEEAIQEQPLEPAETRKFLAELKAYSLQTRL